MQRGLFWIDEGLLSSHQFKSNGELIVNEFVSECFGVEETLASELHVELGAIQCDVPADAGAFRRHFHGYREAHVFGTPFDGDLTLSGEVGSIFSTAKWVQLGQFELCRWELFHAEEIIAHEVSVQTFLAAASLQIECIDGAHVNDDCGCADHAVFNGEHAIVDLNVTVVASGDFRADPSHRTCGDIDGVTAGLIGFASGE